MTYDAVVVGAGSAGLMAARSLARSGARVVLLEGRDRVGGRVWSTTVGARRLPAELGAEFIHGPAPETKALLREAHLEAVATGGSGWFRGPDGLLRPENRDFGPYTQALEFVRSLPNDVTVDEALSRLESNPATREYARSARAFVEGFDAADPAVASARAILDEWSSGVDSSSMRPRGSYGPLFDYLQRSCVDAGAEIVLSTSVRRIQWQPGAVSVEALDASGESRSYRARVAIVTLPVSVLRADIAFAPQLPEPHRVALDQLLIGDAVRVVLAFRDRFWERLAGGRYRGLAFFRDYGSTFGAYWVRDPNVAIVVAWVGGPRATELSVRSADELVETARDGFGGLFGVRELARREFDEGIVHDWQHDPFSRGAYSYVAVGGEDARTVFAVPLDGTLFFAGEAVSTGGEGGTVNGAFATGERAAQEAAAALGAKGKR